MMMSCSPCTNKIFKDQVCSGIRLLALKKGRGGGGGWGRLFHRREPLILRMSFRRFEEGGKVDKNV